MNNTLSDPAHPARLNTNRIETSNGHSKNDNGTEKTANDASQKLANNGFDSSQITCVVDEIIGKLVLHPWEDNDDWNPSFESGIGQSIDLKRIGDVNPAINLKQIVDLKPVIDSKPLTDNPVKPIDNLIENETGQSSTSAEPSTF